jgi:hypothetical protein
MTILYEVVTKKTYKVVQQIQAQSQKEAELVGETLADYDLNYDGNELTITTETQAFAKEPEKVFVASYSKPTRDIGDPCEPPYVIIYQVHAEHVVDRSHDFKTDPYYQLRYFTRGGATRPYGKLFYIEEYPYKDEDFVREAAQNWASGIKKLDLDYSLAKNKKNMVDTHLGNGYGSYGRLK